MVRNDNWCVAVFKCKPEHVKSVLIDFYDFVSDLQGIESFHFLIRDRVDDEVVFSFRVLAEDRSKKIVMSKLHYKLTALVPEEKYAIDPDKDHPLHKYVTWSAKEGIEKHGREGFNIFCSFLSQLSNIVVSMAKKGYFSSAERVEMVHVISWMLGCTEYGLLTIQRMEVGYFDRIANRTVPYLREKIGQQKSA
jgi:hypothetical protein